MLPTAETGRGIVVLASVRMVIAGRGVLVATRFVIAGRVFTGSAEAETSETIGRTIGSSSLRTGGSVTGREVPVIRGEDCCGQVQLVKSK